MDIGPEIEALGWRQGCFLLPSLVSSAQSIDGRAAPVDDGSVYLVISQSCDLAHRKPDDEPWCEALRLKPLQKADSRVRDGKNPRRLHFSIVDNGQTHFVEALAHERYFLPRRLISEVGEAPPPDLTCHPRDLVVVKNWLGKRYTRPAFPTAFSQRLTPDKERAAALAKLIETNHHLLVRLYLAIDPFTELVDDSTPYKAFVLMVAKEATLEDILRAKEADVFRSAIEDYLVQRAGIDVGEVRLLPDSQTSLQLIGRYLPWDHDYLTVRDGDEPTIAVEAAHDGPP